MPDTIDRAHYIVTYTAPDARRAAMADALALFRAAGRARRMASDATADWFDPARANLIAVLLMYAWASRCRKDLLPYHRDQARSAVKAYRMLKTEGKL